MRAFFSTSTARVAIVALAVVIALVLQTTVFPHLAWRGVVPDLVLRAAPVFSRLGRAQQGRVRRALGSDRA